MTVIALIDALEFDRKLFRDAVQTYFQDAKAEVFGGPDRQSAAAQIRALGLEEIDLIAIDIARGQSYYPEGIELIDTLCRHGQADRLILLTPKDRVDRAVRLEIMADRPSLQKIPKPWPVKQLLDGVGAAIERTQQWPKPRIHISQLAP